MLGDRRPAQLADLRRKNVAALERRWRWPCQPDG
jgi:hypothetical protein